MRAWLLIAPLGLWMMLSAGCGSGTSAVINNPTPIPSPTPVSTAKFLYVANEVSANISGFSVNRNTGALTPLAGFPVLSGINPVYLIHDPQNKFLIVVDIAEDTLHVYGIDPNTGALTEISPSPYAVGKEPRAAAIDPSGQFVYVASQSLNSVAAFTMNASGVLTAVPGSPFATGGTSTTGSFGCCVAIDPTGKFVFVGDLTSVYSFSVNTSNGALTLVSTMPGSLENGLAVDPAGKFLYAVGGFNSIQTYNINPTTGALNAIHCVSNGDYEGLIHHHSGSRRRLCLHGRGRRHVSCVSSAKRSLHRPGRLLFGSSGFAATRHRSQRRFHIRAADRHG